MVIVWILSLLHYGKNGGRGVVTVEIVRRGYLKLWKCVIDAEIISIQCSKQVFDNI